MEQQELILRERRDFSDVLNASFRFIRQEFKPLFSMVFLYTIVPLVGSSLMAAFHSVDVWQVYFQGLLNNTPDLEAPNFWIYGLMMLIGLISNVLIVGITYEYMAMYHKYGRGNFSNADVIKALCKDFFPIIGYNIIVGIVLLFAFLFFIIPGIYMAVPLSMIIIVKTVERNGFSVNWGRCFKLINNNWWITFGIIIVAYIIVSMASMVFGMPAVVYGIVQGVTTAQGGAPEINHISLSIFSIISTVGTYMLYIVLYTIIGFQYFSLSATDGSQSIMDKINQIGQSEENQA
ncbi:hypothetical protein [Carboxylicivirga marina]|uniref:Glycerophosphoryl diester phosphodiesterase membrane domain-containing protein n=1 Tax=Carboxylicivirga marina TaxID=2800988 RepID=A0ABS1HIQ4_9BACT|nr:hypothetical protein [Carboxylicivirga marina]MBK3517432.1 hypothetical protein [Carboxylicivirga marina]